MRATPSISARAWISRASDHVDPIGGLAVVGVDVLAEQRDLDRAGRHELARFAQHGRRRPRILGAARIGHDAEGAELVAAFLDRQEGRAGAHALRRGQVIELALGREVGVEHARTRQALAGAAYRGLALGLGQKLGQAVVGLRAHDDVDGGLAAHDLLALGLGDAARDGDGEIAAFGAALALGIAQAAELGIDLLRGMLADVAGVQHDQVGLLGRVGHGIAQRPQDVGHAVRIVDVHLAPVGADEHALALPVGADVGHRSPLQERPGSIIARGRWSTPPEPAESGSSSFSNSSPPWGRGWEGG